MSASFCIVVHHACLTCMSVILFFVELTVRQKARGVVLSVQPNCILAARQQKKQSNEQTNRVNLTIKVAIPPYWNSKARSGVR